MNRLTLYLLRHLSTSMLFVTAGLTLVIWLTQSLRLLEVVIDGGAPIGMFLQLMLVTLPTFLSIVLPIAALVAILFTYNRLTQDSELVVMRAAGVGPFGLARPALMLGLLTTLACYVLTLQVSPWAHRELVQLERLARSEFSTVFLRDGVFNDVDEGLTVYVRRRGAEGDLEGIMIHDSRVPERPVTVLAERGTTVEGPSGTRVVVYNGQRQEMDRATGRMSQLFFDRYAIDLTVFESEYAAREPEARERSLGELIQAQRDPQGSGEERQRLTTELHQRLSAPLSGIGFAMTALAALLTGEFNRRGQVKRILAGVVAVVLLQSANLGAANLASDRPDLAPALYVIALLPTVVGAWMLARSRLNRRRPGPAIPGR
jgi:lipopolysaccharide export system permease protein